MANIGKILNVAMANGTRLRMTLVGKQLRAVPELNKILKGIANPKVQIAANGRGASGVAGIRVKSGNETLVELAGGLDRSKGNPIFQLRERIPKVGSGSAIMDMNKPFLADNFAASVSSKKGVVSAAIDSAPLKYNAKVNLNESENFINKFNLPKDIKVKVNEMFGQYEELCNPRKGKQIMDGLAEKVNGFLNGTYKKPGVQKIAKAVEVKPKDYLSTNIKTINGKTIITKPKYETNSFVYDLQGKNKAEAQEHLKGLKSIIERDFKKGYVKKDHAAQKFAEIEHIESYLKTQKTNPFA
jgi:ribosomal protein S20